MSNKAALRSWGGRLSAFALALLGCTSTVPNRSPLGELFPRATGTSLAGEEVQIPDAFSGEPTVLMIGYTQRSQFDIDRWILGLVQLETPGRLVELPTIEGIFPGLFANRIDEGMRRGIPEEDWPSVITVYEDAGAVRRFTGTERENNARVLLLDSAGRVRWAADRGYSASQVRELDRLLRVLHQQGGGEPVDRSNSSDPAP